MAGFGMQTNFASFVKNAASVMGGKKDHAPTKKGQSSGDRSVAWFFAAACGASVILRLLDLYVFLDEDDAVISELCAFAAFAAGAVLFVRRGKIGSDKPARFARPCVAKVPTKETTPAQPRKNSDTRQARSPKGQASVSPGKRTSSEDSTLLLLSDADATHVEAILDLCHKGDFVKAEDRFQELVQRRGHSDDSAADMEFDLFTGESTPKPKPSRSAVRPAAAVHSLIEACLEAGDALRASAWLEALHTCGLRGTPKTLLAIAEDLSSGASTVEAEKLFKTMLDAGAQLDIQCYQILFQRILPSDDTVAIRDWLKRLGKRSTSELVTGYIALIRTRAVMGEVDQAEFWMKHAMEANMAKSHHLYNAVIHACARAGETDRAEQWLERMHEAGSAQRSPPGLEKSSTTSERGLAPDVVSYSAIMDACAQKGETSRAEAWFDRMVAAGVSPDTVSLNTLIKAHARASDVAGAERWLVRAREMGVRLDAFGFNALIAAAARSEDPQTAERWLRQMLEDGAQPDVVSYNSVIHAWAKRGDAEGADRLIALMCDNDVEPDVVTLGVAVHACARAGDPDRAEQVFNRIVARGKTQPDAIGYNALINAAVKSGDTARAERWLGAMIEAGVAPSVVSYTTVLHAHAREGNLEAAERGLERMVAAGVEANVVSYSALIHACMKAGDVTRAEKWFEKMQAAGIQANAVSYSVLLNVCAKAGDYQRAERWLERMCADNVVPNVVCYNNVIDACSKAGRADRAELWLRRLVGDEAETGAAAKFPRAADLAPTRQSYTTAAQAHATHGAWVDVERLLAQMEAKGIQMDEFSLTVLLSSYSRARPRQRERAETAFQAYCHRGLKVTRPPLRVLRSVVGSGRFESLLAEQGMKVPTGDSAL